MNAQEASTSGLQTVLITGASGRTGRLLMERLCKSARIKPIGTVRSEASKEQLMEYLKREGVVDPNQYEIRILDIVQNDTARFDQVFEGVDTAVLLTSAIPNINYLQVPIFIFDRLNPFATAVRSFISYKEGSSPREVDYEGAKRQVDAAARAGVKHFAFVSSMGGTKPDFFLNKYADNIVLWKRKAEQYLINKSSEISNLQYTIVHPGGMVIAEAAIIVNSPIALQPSYGEKIIKSGERELVVTTEADSLMKGTSSIPRSDLAALMEDVVSFPEVCRNTSFDVGSRREGKLYKGGKDDFTELMAKVKSGKTYSYRLPEDLDLVLGLKA